MKVLTNIRIFSLGSKVVKEKKKVFYVTKCLLTYLLTNFQVKKWKYGSLLRMQHFISSVDKKKHKLNYAISF